MSVKSGAGADSGVPGSRAGLVTSGLGLGPEPRDTSTIPLTASKTSATSVTPSQIGIVDRLLPTTLRKLALPRVGSSRRGSLGCQRGAHGVGDPPMEREVLLAVGGNLDERRARRDHR
jgi:hypothetical protein